MKTSNHKHHTGTQTQQNKPFFNRNLESNASINEKANETPFFHPTTIQPKLEIGDPNDEYEREADVMADQVMRMEASGSAGEENIGAGQVMPKIQTKCAACEQEEPSIQRSSTKEEEHTNLQPKLIQREAIESGPVQPMVMRKTDGGGVATPSLVSKLNQTKGGGSPLSKETNQSMSLAFGTDFSQVRIHTNQDAVEMNQGIQAKAFTHGSDVYFNKGAYQPESSEGKKLLAHELTHVVQQGGISEIQRVPIPNQQSRRRNPLRVSSGLRHRPRGIITRQFFDNYLRTHFNVSDIHTGTKQEQERRSTRRNVPPVTIPNWQRWDPGSASQDYSSIINGIEDMIDTLGAMPRLDRVIFFKVDYEPNPQTGVGVPQRSVGASYGAGELTIYEAYTGSTRPAISISTVSGTNQASPDRDRDIRETIIHELGHGVAEAAMAEDMQTFIRFRALVGWIGSPPQLFDIGQPTVRAAIANNTAPPSSHRITRSRWNDHTVSEQPMSDYAVRGGPGEDFAESITAYVMNLSVLQQRSPRRFQFIRNNMQHWIRSMNTRNRAMIRPEKGDFNLPSGSTRVA